MLSVYNLNFYKTTNKRDFSFNTSSSFNTSRKKYDDV
jgi:hypothetical protein